MATGAIHPLLIIQARSARIYIFRLLADALIRRDLQVRFEPPACE